MLQLVITLVLCFAAGIAKADCEIHMPYKPPVDSDQVLCKGGFVIGYSHSRKIPDWAAYKLTRESISGGKLNGDTVLLDDAIAPKGRASLDNYRGTGFDCGHLASMEAVNVSVESLEESFKLSNMAPQLPGLNRAGWSEIERIVLEYAIDHQEVYVISGTHGDIKELSSSPEGISSSNGIDVSRVKSRGNGLALDGEVSIPAFFYKAYYIPSLEVGGVYILPHDNVSKWSINYHLYELEAGSSVLGLPLFEGLTSKIAG